MKSIRGRLQLLLLLVILAPSLLHGWASYQIAVSQTNDLFDAQLRQAALIILSGRFSVVTNADEPNTAGGTAPPTSPFDLMVRLEDGTGAPYLTHPLLADLKQRRTGFATTSTRYGRVRTFGLQAGPRFVLIGQLESQRSQVVTQVAFRNLLPLALLVPMLYGLAWFAVRSSLRPLELLAGQVQQRSPAQLDSLPDDRLPSELSPIVGALNHLLSQIRAVLTMQRDFVANAAHEIRSPVTALQLKIQVISAMTPGAERDARIAELPRSVRRVGHLLEQLMQLARHEREIENAGRRHCCHDLLQTCQRQAFSLMPVAEEHGMSITVHASTSDPVRALGPQETELDTLLRNLIDNAIRHGEPNGRIDIAVGIGADGRPTITIADTGPGIPLALRKRVFERFYRCPQAESKGSGLGLAIVKAIADKYGIRLTLDDARTGIGSPGLKVALSFDHA